MNSAQQTVIEITGNLVVHHPIKPSWWAPHRRECDSVNRLRADCDCGAEAA